jgi:hypothetical protein
MSLSVKYTQNGTRKNKPVLVSMAIRGLLVTKGKVHPRTGHESPEESNVYLYSYLNLGTLVTK